MYKILASNDCNNSSTDKHYDATKIVIASGTMIDPKSRLLAVSKNLRDITTVFMVAIFFYIFYAKKAKKAKKAKTIVQLLVY